MIRPILASVQALAAAFWLLTGMVAAEMSRALSAALMALAVVLGYAAWSTLVARGPGPRLIVGANAAMALGVIAIAVWSLLFAKDSGGTWLLVYLAPTLVPLQMAMRLRAVSTNSANKTV